MSDRINKITSIIITIAFTANSLSYAGPAVSPQSIIHNPQSINIPESYGRIEKSQVSSLKSQVILIKDAHCNYEAQRNIAKILDILIKDYKIDLVGIEGASGDVDPSVIAGSPDAKRRKGAADKYLKKGWLTASEALAMERGKDYGFSIWGVEDFKLYLNDLKVFREVYEGCGIAKRFIEISKDVISNLKNKIYSKDAFEFDKKVSEYRENSLALSEFINYLAKTRPDYIREFHNLRLVLKAIKIEKNIDFNKVAEERDELIKECGKKLPKEEIEQLVRNSLLYRLGKISSLEYYKYLEPLAINLKLEAANLRRYIRNIRLHSKINEDVLFNEIDKLIEDIYRYYIKDGIGIRLHEADEYVYLLNKLLRLEIARGELARYRKYCLRPSQIVDFLKVQGNLNNINIPPEFTDQGFILQVESFYKQPEEFYKYAIERDRALVENLVARMKDENKDRAVLIAGGFHADGAEKLLNEKGIEVITITPSITKEDTEAKRIYLSRMMDERLQPDRMLNEMGLGNLSATAVTTVNLRGIYGPVLAGIRDDSVRGELERALAGAKTHEDFARAIKAVIDRVRVEPGTEELVLRTLEDLHCLATTGRLSEAGKGGQAEAGKLVWDFETESINIDGITVTAPLPFMPILREMLNKLYLPEPLYAGDFHRLTPMKPIDVFAFTADGLGVKGREIRIIIGEMDYVDISEDGKALEISISKFEIANPNMGFSGAIDDVLKILILNKGQVVTTRNIAEQRIRESSRVRVFGRYLQNEGAAYNITPGMQKAYYRGVNLARLQQLSEEKKFTGANSDSLFVDLGPTIWASKDIGCAEIYGGKNIGVIFKLRKETIDRDFKLSTGWQGWTVNEIMLRSKDEKPIEIPLSGAYIEEILVFDEASYEQARRLFPDMPIRRIFNPDQADQYLAENGEVTNVQLEEYYSREERLPEYMGRPLSYDCKALQLAGVSSDASYEQFRTGLVSKMETAENEIEFILRSAGLRCEPYDPVKSTWIYLAGYVVRNTFAADAQTRERIKGPLSLYKEVQEQLAIFNSLEYLRAKAVKFKIRQELEETAKALTGQEGLRNAFSKAIDTLSGIEGGGWASRGYDKADEVKWHDYTHAGNNTLEAVSAMKRIQESLRQKGYEIPEEAVLLTAIAGMYHDVGYYKADEMFGTIKVDHEKRSMEFVKNNAGELGLSARDVTLVCLVIAGTQAGVQPSQWNEMEELVKKILDGKADESDVRKLTEMIKGLTEQTEIGLNLIDKNELSLLLGITYGARAIASLDIWDTRENAVELIASLRKEFARDHEILRRYLIDRGVKQDDIPELVKAKDKGTFLKEKGVAVDDKVLKAAIEISKIVVAPSDAEQVGGTQGFYLYFADKRVKELGVWDFIDMGAKERFEETRARVKEKFDEMQARIKTSGAIIPELQEQFGAFGERPLYRYLIGPAFEEFGLLGYPLVLMLRPLNIISRAEIQQINRNIKEIFKHTLGIGFRGLPLFSGVALSFISPFLASVGIILVFATGIVFVTRHPKEKDIITVIITFAALFIMGLSAILINSAGEFLIVGLALIPTFLLIHSEVNIIDDIRAVKPKGSAPVTAPGVIEEDEEPTIPIVYPRRKVEGRWRLYNMLKAFIDTVSIPRIAAIPDIHGNLTRLDEILERVEGQADKIVFLGDYMDKGRQGIAVVERVIQLTKEGRAIPLMGNHELLFIMSMMGDYHSFLNWMLNGGIKVLKELAEEGLIEETYQARFAELITLFENYMQKYKDATIAISAMHADGILNELHRIARENARLREMAAWMKENLNLYHIGENGALYVHAGVRIDKNGNAVLRYARDRVIYSGLEALAELEEGMRKAFREDDLTSPALRFLKNTRLSPLWVREAADRRDMFEVLEETGCEKLLDQLGIAMLIVGHTQVDDLVNIGNVFFAIDRKMVYGKGAVLRTHPEGLVYDPTTDRPRYVLGRPGLQRLVWDGKVRAHRLINIIESRLMGGRISPIRTVGKRTGQPGVRAVSGITQKHIGTEGLSESEIAGLIEQAGAKDGLSDRDRAQLEGMLGLLDNRQGIDTEVRKIGLDAEKIGLEALRQVLSAIRDGGTEVPISYNGVPYTVRIKLVKADSIGRVNAITHTDGNVIQIAIADGHLDSLPHELIEALLLTLPENKSDSGDTRKLKEHAVHTKVVLVEPLFDPDPSLDEKDRVIDGKVKGRVMRELKGLSNGEISRLISGTEEALRDIREKEVAGVLDKDSADLARTLAQNISNYLKIRRSTLPDSVRMTTSRGRLPNSLEAIRELTGRFEGGATIYDIGVGWDIKEGPVTTRELAEAVRGKAEVIGFDNQLPQYTITTFSGTALFDENDNLIYLVGNLRGEYYLGTIPSEAGENIPREEREYCMELARRLKQEAGQNTEYTDSEGRQIIFNPVKRHEADNLRLVKADLFRMDEVCPAMHLPKAHVVRIANVLIPHYMKNIGESINRALQALSSLVHEDGYVLIGHTDPATLVKDEECLVYRKKGNRFVLESYMFSGMDFNFGVGHSEVHSPARNVGDALMNIIGETWPRLGEYDSFMGQGREQPGYNERNMEYNAEMMQFLAERLREQGFTCEALGTMISVKIENPDEAEESSLKRELMQRFAESYLGLGIPREVYGRSIRDELVARFGVDIDGDLEPVLGQKLKDLLEILEEDGRVTEDEVGVIVDKAKLAVSVFNEYKGKGLKERLDLAQEIVAVQWAREELERNKVPGFVNELIKALGGDEKIIRELVMELYNYNGYDDYFVLMLSGIRTMLGIKEGTEADRYLRMLDRYVMVKSRFEVKENRFVSSGDEVYDVLMKQRRLRGTTEDAEALLSKVADIVARYIVDNNEILNLFKDAAKKKQVREGIEALIRRKGLAEQIKPQRYLADTADLNLVRPVVVDARYLLIPKKGGGYAISAMAEQLKWVLLRAGDNLMILYDGAAEGRDLIAEWLGVGVGRFITEAEYPKDTEGVVAMLTHATAERLKDKSGNHRVVKGKENGEDDLMLMGHVAGILGSVEVLSEESIGNPLRELYKAYYKEDRTEMVQRIIESIRDGVSIVIVLPPIAPFVRPYYNALKQAMEMTGSAA